jgi:hypothetical protein
MAQSGRSSSHNLKIGSNPILDFRLLILEFTQTLTAASRPNVPSARAHRLGSI